ncbi:helix-turn-helix transcriptional regulator [Lacisediminihabitans sp. H27-G8]|uniref:helix-turn-helix transcriptional regulator n=1 Tax=Lacisediminihabitans sp. H27-G8 TaxID=3111909 RepID=UPI0038FD21FB
MNTTSSAEHILENESPTSSPFLTEEQAAARLQLSPRTLRNWRNLAQGPAALKLGGAVRYHSDALDAWALGSAA